MSHRYIDDLRLLLEGSRRPLLIALGLSLLSVMFDLAAMILLPVVVGWALSSTALMPRGATADLQALIGNHSTAAVLLIVVGLFVIRAILAILLGAYLSHLSQWLREHISRRLVSGYLSIGYPESLKRSIGENIATITAHGAHFSVAVMLPMLKLIVDTLSILAIMGFIAWLAPWPTLIVATALGVTGLGYHLLVRKSSEKHSRRVTSLEGVLHEQVLQALQGAREVRIFRAQKYFSRETRSTLTRLAYSQARLGAIYWLPRALGELVLILIAIGYMGYSIQHGQNSAMVVSDLSAFAFAGMRLLPAFAQSLAGFSAVRAGRAVTGLLANELRRIATNLKAASSSLPPLPASEPIERIELDGVSFGYAADQPILYGISLEIRRGQSIGVMGRSGAGKSTLGDILLGLLQPVSGTILINGERRDLGNRHWWDRVGFVPQTPFIANDSLARNIAYGLPEAEIDAERLADAIQAAQLEPLVQSWPEGENTVLGDQGVRLSGGQRQRVAIARALYRRREFLVLDEATSALDQQTEQEVIQALEALQGRITMLVIAHRLSTLENCDFIIELQQGQIVRTTRPRS